MATETRPEGPAKAPRVSYWTLGCRLNQHDTAAMRDALAGEGWAEAGLEENPEVVVVNTCTVTARADQEARQLIRSLAARHPGVRIVVTGCYAQRAPDEIARLPGVAAVLGIAERERIASALRETLSPALSLGATPAEKERAGDSAAILVGPARDRRPFAPASPRSFGRTRALLKVQDGCNSFCAYCIVPIVRGRSRSLPLKDALEQARRLLDAGFHELVLTGADLGAYGRDLSAPGLLPKLVEELLALGSAHRVRLSSIEPNKLDPGLLGMIGREPRFCRHLHLPLQSGSRAVLRAMRRPYSPEEYAALVEEIAGRSTAGIGADVIVGFPGEGEPEFEETYRFLDRLPISYLHVFRYSPRPGTAAAERPASDVATARRRSERLRELGDRKRLTFYRSLLGQRLQALVEGKEGPNGWSAMTDLYASVRIRERPSEPGLIPVRVEALMEGVLHGSPSG